MNDVVLAIRLPEGGIIVKITRYRLIRFWYISEDRTKPMQVGNGTSDDIPVHKSQDKSDWEKNGGDTKAFVLDQTSEYFGLYNKVRCYYDQIFGTPKILPYAQKTPHD